MAKTNTNAAATAQQHEPQGVRAGFSIKAAVEWSGLSRTGLYRAAAEGRLIMRKAGRTTIVDGPSLAALVASLPVANIRTGKRAA
ncbi:MAG: excisionase [Acetobacteraceae bacterium]|nr:excisionase [Acetobacteraceae bacterium]